MSTSAHSIMTWAKSEASGQWGYGQWIAVLLCSCAVQRQQQGVERAGVQGERGGCNGEGWIPCGMSSRERTPKSSTMTRTHLLRQLLVCNQHHALRARQQACGHSPLLLLSSVPPSSRSILAPDAPAACL